MELGKKIRGVEKSAMDKLLAYDWPGNVRELENVIKRATILTRGQTLGIHRLDSFKPEDTKSNGSQAEALVEKTVTKWFRQKGSSTFFGPGQIYKNIINFVEKTLIKEALESCENNQVKASELLGMNRATLRKKMAEYELK